MAFESGTKIAAKVFAVHTGKVSGWNEDCNIRETVYVYALVDIIAFAQAVECFRVCFWKDDLSWSI